MPADRKKARLVFWITWPVALLFVGWTLRVGLANPDFSDREITVSQTGHWSTRLLLLALALAPISRTIKQGWLKQCRRTVGLLAFGFCCVHGGFYIWSAHLWPHGLSWLFNRPYLIAGIVATVLLIPMALTSSNRAMRWLGPVAWRRIHLSIYPATALALIHECLYAHDSSSELVLHAAIIGALFAVRFRTAFLKSALLHRVQGLLQPRRAQWLGTIAGESISVAAPGSEGRELRGTGDGGALRP